MKSTIGLTLLILSLLAPGAQARVSLSSIDSKLDQLLAQTGQCPVAIQFLGHTVATTDGRAQGLGGTGNMDALCDAEFPGSRMCTAGEATQTVTPATTPDPGFGWVRGQFSVAPNSDPATSGALPFMMVEEATGLARDVDRLQVENQNCGQWGVNTSSRLGLVFGRIGASGGVQLFYTACNSDFKVSCCAPKRLCPVE